MGEIHFLPDSETMKTVHYFEPMILSEPDNNGLCITIFLNRIFQKFHLRWSHHVRVVIVCVNQGDRNPVNFGYGVITGPFRHIFKLCQIKFHSRRLLCINSQ